jgi:hypothetical protein
MWIGLMTLTKRGHESAGVARPRSVALAVVALVATSQIVAAEDIKYLDVVGHSVEVESRYAATFRGNGWEVIEDRTNTFMLYLDSQNHVSVRVKIYKQPKGGGAATTEDRTGVLLLGKEQATPSSDLEIVSFQSGALVLTNKFVQGAERMQINFSRVDGGFKCVAKEIFGRVGGGAIEVVDPSTGRTSLLTVGPVTISFCKVAKGNLISG